MRNNHTGIGRLCAIAALSCTAVLAMRADTNAEQATISVTGTVDDGCTVAAEFNQATANLGKLVNDSGRLTDRSVTLSLGEVSCNAGAAKLSVQSEGKGLKRQGASPSPMPAGYTDFVPYSTKADWGALHVQFFANGAATAQDSAESPTAIDSPLSLTISTSSDQTIQPLDGTYTDTLIVKVGFLL
jgi:hypothetical protein